MIIKFKKINYIAVGDVNMKKLILGMMLVMVFLSFSNDRDNCVDRHDFDDLKLRAEAGYNEEQQYKEELNRKRKVMLSNVFGDNRSLSDDSDSGRVDYFDDLIFDDNRLLSNDSDSDRVDYFDDLIFDNNRSLSNDKNRGVDRHDFDDLKLRVVASYNKEELKRKRRVMLSNIFGN